MSERIEERLATLTMLKDNWDSYSGRPMTAAALDLARVLLVTEPAIIPRSNGGVALEWYHGGWEVDLCIEPDGSASLFVERASQPSSLVPPVDKGKELTPRGQEP